MVQRRDTNVGTRSVRAFRLFSAAAAAFLTTAASAASAAAVFAAVMTGLLPPAAFACEAEMFPPLTHLPLIAHRSPGSVSGRITQSGFFSPGGPVASAVPAPPGSVNCVATSQAQYNPYSDNVGTWYCNYDASVLEEGHYNESLLYHFHYEDTQYETGYVEDCSASTGFDFYIDRTSPTLTVSYPEAFPPGLILSSSDTLRGSAADSLMLCNIKARGERPPRGTSPPIALVDFYTHPTWSGYSGYVAGNTAKDFAYPLLELGSGAVDLALTASDCAGLSSSQTAVFVVDAEAPRVDFPAPAVTFASGLDVLGGTASDDVLLAKVEITVQDADSGRWWDGSTFTASGGQVAVPLAVAPGSSVTWAYSALSAAYIPPQGATWIVRVSATDFVGRSTAALASIHILPTVALTQVPPRGVEGACTGVNPADGNNTFRTGPPSFGPRSPGIELALSHTSKGVRDSVWGYGWSSPNDDLLLVRSNGAILWKEGSGTEHNFYPPPAGAPDPDTYQTPVQTFTTLRVTARGGGGKPTAAELRKKGDTRVTFTVLADGVTLRPTTLTDRNGSTLSFARDAQGRLSGVTDVYGRSVSVAYAGNRVSGVTDSAGRTVTYTYDGAGNRLTETSAHGTTTFEYDAAHHITAVAYPNASRRLFTYDGKGRVLVEEDEGGADRRSYAYFASSTVVTDALGRTTLLETTARDGLKRPARIVDAGAGEQTLQYDGAFNVAARTDPAGRSTAFGYDGRGNLLALTDPAQGVTAIAYDSVFDQPTSVRDPRDNTTALAYDGQGNLTQITDPANRSTTLAYDARGHVLAVTDARMKTTRFTYDADGGLATVTDPMGRTTTLTRDTAGRVTRSVDASGKATGFQYDAAGNLTRVTDALLGVTAYGYVPGRETKLLGTVTDAKSQPTAFAYDAAARLTSITNALSQVKTFAYDLKGNLTRVTDARNRPVTFGYDSRDRVQSKTTPEGTVNYQYDAVGNLTAAQNHNGANLAMSYDALDRVTRVVQTLPTGFSATIGYGYDANGNRTSMTTPWGSFAYVYDALNRLTLMTTPGGQSYAFEYDELGRRTRLTYPNGVVTNYVYDDASQLELIEHALAGETFAVAQYTYDAAGNRTSMTDVIGTHRYTYDGLHRLTRAEHPAGWPAGPQVETFSYDAVGNRTADQTVTGYQYDAANRLLENNSHAYAYDAAGNTTGKTDKATTDTTSYAYDTENQLTGVTLPSGSVGFQYDAIGRRVEKAVTAAGVNRFIYDDEDLLAILDGNNDLLALIIHGPSSIEPIGVVSGATNFYVHSDGLGSVVAHTNDTGVVVERMFYGAYGSPRIVDFHGPVPSPILSSFTGSPYLFAGREFDEEIGLYDFGERFLDSTIGTFLTEDPVWNPNAYRYALSNPILLTDIDGTSPGSSLGKLIVKTVKGIRRSIRAKTAMLLARKGALRGSGNIDLPQGRKDTRRIIKKTWPSKKVRTDPPDQAKGFKAHSQPQPRPPGARRFHATYGAAVSVAYCLTAERWVGEGPAATLIDFFNPATIPYDILTLPDTIAEITDDSMDETTLAEAP